MSRIPGTSPSGWIVLLGAHLSGIPEVVVGLGRLQLVPAVQVLPLVFTGNGEQHAFRPQMQISYNTLLTPCRRYRKENTYRHSTLLGAKSKWFLQNRTVSA